MKKILLTLSILSLISCNQSSKELESSFSNIGNKLDSLNKIEESKIEKHFNEINSKQIIENDVDDSAMIYYSTIKHNRIVDSLITKLKSIEDNDLEKRKITKQFEDASKDLKDKLKNVAESSVKMKIDSLLKPSDDIGKLPKFAITTKLQSGKLNATRASELLLRNLKSKNKLPID